MPTTLTLLCSGTRGDVQPYVALGLRLQSEGCRVVIATHPPFRALVEGWGLTFAPVHGSPNDLLARDEFRDALALSHNPVRNLIASLRFQRAARPVFAQMLASAWQACRGTGGVIVGLPTTWGWHIAQALEVPCVFAPVQPLSRTAAFPSPLLPFTFSLGARYNRLTHRLIEHGLWLAWRGLFNRWRAHSLQLPTLSFAGPFPEIYRRGTPFVYGFSSHVVPRPADWPASHAIAGYWFLDRRPEWRPPPELERFLDAGEPPVYIGFGSLGWQQATPELITRATLEAGVRAVVSRPDLQARLPESILPVEDVPHEWLFPKVRAVAHSGGAGVTAAGLRAGRPTIVLPFASDGFFWGGRIAALGAGPRPLPRRSLTVQKLARALSQAVNESAYAARAAGLAGQIALEDGAGRAARLIREQAGV